MQVRKVAVVATGALATAAAMGSTPAFAADSAGAGAPEVAPATVGVLDVAEGTQRASDDAMRELAEQWLAVTPEQAWSAPWEQEPPQILSVGSGSALSLAPWQHCGSNGPWVAGVTVPVASPATVLGDCRNGNIDIADDGGDALFSILDNTAISALSWQMCGSNGVGGLGVNVPIASPATVTGGCDNGNITIGTPEDGYPEYPDHPEYPDYPYEPSDDYSYHQHEPAEAGAEEADGAEQTAVEAAEEIATKAETSEPEQTVVAGSAPWEQEAPQILSAGSGSAVSAGSWQHCGSSGPWILGATAPIASPSTVLDECRNGNIDIHGDGGDALFSFLDNSALSVASWQMCGSNGVGGLGINVPIASPATAGGCDNGNISIG